LGKQGGKVKISKWLFLFLISSLLISCSGKFNETIQPTTTPPTPAVPILDFDHPRLHELAANHPLVIREIVRNRWTEEEAYAAIILDTEDPILRRKMLLFQLTQSGSVLLYESEPYYYMSFNILAVDPIWLIDNSSYYFHQTITGGIYPMDENYRIVPVDVSYGGNCYDCSWMMIIGISENGIAKDITPVIPFTPKTFFDTKGDNKFKIVTTRYYESAYGATSRAGSPFAFRLYSWDGSEFVDVSENEKDFFDQKTAEVISELQKTYAGPLRSNLVMPFLSQIFFNYESSERVEEGWEQIQLLGDLSHWDTQNTPPEEIQAYHKVFDCLEQRKNQGSTTPPLRCY